MDCVGVSESGETGTSSSEDSWTAWGRAKRKLEEALSFREDAVSFSSRQDRLYGFVGFGGNESVEKEVVLESCDEKG